MSYQKYYSEGWKSGEAGGTPITPEALNHMEAGIISGENVRNLLDNSYFLNPVNQRGHNWDEFTTAHYTIDRWKAAGHMEVSVITNEGIMLHCKPAATERNGFTQYLEARPSTGTAVTLAIMEFDGTLHVGSVKWPGSNYAIAFALDNGIQGRVYPDRVSIMLPSDEMINLACAALYEGEYTAETLPKYQPKGYAAELLECQRYYLSYNTAVSGYGYASSASSAYIVITTPAEMRAVPTMSGDTLFNVRTASGTLVSEVPLGTAVYKHGNQLRFGLNITGKGIAKDTAITAIRNAGSIEFSADL